MANNKKFGLLRRILIALGLSKASSDEVVAFVDSRFNSREETYTHSRSETADTEVDIFPYNLRDDFLSAAEFSFFKVLQHVIGNKAVICTKVNLSDIFWVKSDDYSKYRTYTNKIDRKHVDFLICNATTMRPLFGIELDDKSHQRKDRQARDTFVDGVFDTANLPLLHIPAQRSYRTSDIELQIAQFLDVQSNSQPSTDNHIIETSAFMKMCPKCGGEMVLREARRGKNKGNQFWGCSNYPQCKTILKYKKQPTE